MTRPDDWSDLAEVWTAPQDASQPTADTTAGLVDAMRRRAWMARLNFHIEAWGAVVAGLAGGGFALRHHAPLVGGAALAFAAFALVATLWARRGAAPGEADTPRAALQAAIRQARSGVRWARAGQAISLAALVFIAVLGVARPTQEALPLYLGGGAFLAVCAAFYERHARRCLARIARHEAALADLDDPA